MTVERAPSEVPWAEGFTSGGRKRSHGKKVVWWEPREVVRFRGRGEGSAGRQVPGVLIRRIRGGGGPPA